MDWDKVEYNHAQFYTFHAIHITFYLKFRSTLKHLKHFFIEISFILNIKFVFVEVVSDDLRRLLKKLQMQSK